MSKRHQGFTLIEVAVVIAIIGALLGTLLVPLATQIEAAKIKATDRDMDEIREALLGFAMSNLRLPCPDHNDDGLEDIENNICDNNVGNGAPDADYAGFLPFADLGVGTADAWGRHYLYEVSAEFTFVAVTGASPPTAVGRLDLGDLGGLTVLTRGDNPTTFGRETRFLLTIGNNVPAVIVSRGPNGHGATTVDNTPVTDPDLTDNDEIRDERNYNRASFDVPAPFGSFPQIYMSRTRTIQGAACDDNTEGQAFCMFDDRVSWLSANLLFNRLVTAGILP
jgi:prepilin-type N-terminal cleavage/methylation domain-containing protein